MKATGQRSDGRGRVLAGHGRTRIVAVVCAVLAAAVTGVGAASGSPHITPGVTGGQPDGSVHPYVAMVLAPGLRSPNCTGVLVRADSGALVVLTDAHCLAAGGARFGSGAGVSFAQSWGPTAPVVRGSFVVDPLYLPHQSALHDLAAIIVPQSAATAAAALAPVGDDERLSPRSTVTVVGDGRPYLGQRRSATEIVQTLTPSWVLLGPGSGNSCDGDSGGPDLQTATATVLALTDQGTCSFDQDTRMDTVEAHWFAGAAAAAGRALGGIRGPLLQPSLLGLAAVRSGSTVTIRVASRYLDVMGGQYQAWAGKTVSLQRWTRSGWVTIRMLRTDGRGNLTASLHIGFRVGLRVLAAPGVTVAAAGSAPVVV